MKPSQARYHYTSSSDYVSQLEFDHIETYSFQRGTAFEEKLMRLRSEVTDISKVNERFAEVMGFSDHDRFLVNDAGQFHPTSIQISAFQKNSVEAEKIKAFMKIDAVDIPAWICSPLYRDAIVFYNCLNEIVSVLNICFSCKYMQTELFNYVNADIKTYKALKEFLIKVGHPIEND